MMRELKFMLHDKAVWVWCLLALTFSASAVVLGTIEVRQQHLEIAELQQLDQIERQVTLSKQSDWGSAAYYTFHLAFDPPSNFAYAALGQRDVSPWKHRIRMLALEGQIYETDANNPDFALIGRFDFVFVASLIAPLLVVLLLFDLRSGEHVAGRLNLIEASVGSTRKLWWQRSILRILALTTALCLPVVIGGLVAGTAPSTLALCVFAVFLYLIFWMAISLWLATANRTGSYNLTILLGVWLLFCVIVPATLTQVIDKTVPMIDGGEIVLTQREAVNDAWDLPKHATYAAFLVQHPEWREHTAWNDEDGFEWKWYYAFQQVGDQKVESRSLAYRQGQARRDELANWLGLISPATLLQRQLEALANTDVRSALEFDQQVRNFHADLRAWYYPKLFQAEKFDTEKAMSTIPKFAPSK
ncbi:ABC transporter permease [Arenicella chitinivorans]|uniref:ABC transporter permease n=1 Tax=Arenicella chitinivorans TaxID=1329800 RepID=A0A918S5K6_9GAMM|nr:DUF3526 domain-containing protein [Arenicella chitinivorans]GHA21375.1 ABC transporter permease [Arenicella chitinivorans]